MTSEIGLISDPKISSIEQAEALDVLRSKKVPASEIDERPGASGRKFSYIKHTYATKLLQNGFGPLWSFEVLNWQVYNDTLYKWVKEKGSDGKDKKVKKPFEQRSIVAQCRLSITYATYNAKAPTHTQVVTEIGAFEPNTGMTTANGVASAASRGLCKCLMRALGVGLELYDNNPEHEITPKKAWNILKRYLEARGIEWTDEFEEELLEKLKENGIEDKQDFVDRFTTAYEVANTFLDTDEDIPMK